MRCTHALLGALLAVLIVWPAHPVSGLEVSGSVSGSGGGDASGGRFRIFGYLGEMAGQPEGGVGQVLSGPVFVLQQVTPCVLSVVSEITTASPGSQVTLRVAVSRPSGIAGGSMAITYDSAVLEPRVAVAGEALNASGLLFVSNLSEPGRILCSLAGATALPSGDGELFSLVFTVRSSAEDGPTVIGIEEAGLFGDRGAPIRARTHAASLTIEGVLTGDVTLDGRVDFADVIFALRLTVGLETADGKRFVAADVNGDGAITIVDAILIFRIVSGQPPVIAKPALSPPVAAAARFEPAKPSGDGRIPVVVVVDRPAGSRAAGFRIAYDAAFGEAAEMSLDGPRDGALVLVNSEGPGEVRMGYAEFEGEPSTGPLTLRLTLPAPGPEGQLTLDLSGAFYGTEGVLAGEAALTQAVDVLPTSFALLQNQPNPFNPSTTIRYELPESGHVTLDVYTILGQRVRRLVDEREEAGRREVVWDGRDRAGRPVASGLYLYRLVVDGGKWVDVRRMVLAK